MLHLDEGTIHAWLDGALAPNEVSAAEAHVQSCEQCSRAVAEARGLIAASSRILAALDDVPAAQAPLTFPVAARRRIPWWRRAGVSYAAAAVALLAVGTTYVMRSASRDALMEQPAAALDEARQEAAPVTTTQFGADSLAALRRAASPTTAASGAANEKQGAMLGARAAKTANEPQADKKEDLTTDRVVQLPGAMPRPVSPTPPPAVRQEDASRRAFAAELAAEAKGKAVVKGRVLDAASGAPVIGAVVSVDTARVVTRTDSAGKFELQAVPLGQQTVSVRALGFEAAQHQMQVSARDSVQLGFALQKANVQLQSVVVTGAAASGERAQGQNQTLTREKAQQAPSAVAASPKLRLEDIRANANSVVGCFTLRAVRDNARDADRSSIASMPSRVELDSKAQERAQREETVVNRARTLEGSGRAESWRFVGDSLELSWMDGTRRRSLRFARDDSRWVSPFAVMEPCSVQPR